MIPEIQKSLTAKVSGGGKLFIPYITAGLPSPQGFVDLFSELAALADAIEVGIPFSDPIMDGPIIQESSSRALKAGVTVKGSLSMIKQCLRYGSAPCVAMTYYNPIHRMGADAFVNFCSDSGVAGLITPDLPFDPRNELTKRLAKKNLAHIQMVSPSTSDKRARLLAEETTGWLYAVSRMGVTGEQQALAESAQEVVDRVKPFAKAPVVLGIGVSNGEQAAIACQYADGVIVGSALVKKVLAGDLDGAVDLARQIREAIDASSPIKGRSSSSESPI